MVGDDPIMYTWCTRRQAGQVEEGWIHDGANIYRPRGRRATQLAERLITYQVNRPNLADHTIYSRNSVCQTEVTAPPGMYGTRYYSYSYEVGSELGRRVGCSDMVVFSTNTAVAPAAVAVAVPQQVQGRLFKSRTNSRVRPYVHGLHQPQHSRTYVRTN